MTLTPHSNADTLCTIMAFAVHTTPVMCLCMLRWCIIRQHVSIFHTYCMKLMWAVICCFTLCGRACLLCNVSHFALIVCMLFVWYMFLLYAQCDAVFYSCFFPHFWIARNPGLFLPDSLPHISNQTSVMVTLISFATLLVHSAFSMCVLDHISIQICKGTLRCL